MSAAVPTTADATAFWQGRRSDDDLLRDWGSTAQLHRRALVDQLHLFPAFASLLEVGCGPGTNLRLIRQAFPWVRLTGVEIDPATAQFANLRLANGSGAQVRCQDVLVDAQTWAPQSVDIVLSCYCLAYVAPGDLTAFLSQMVRVARVGVLIAEPQGGPSWTALAGVMDGLGFPEWRHDYAGGLTAALHAQRRPAKLWGARLAQPVDRLDGLVACCFAPARA